jgi:hypothetical protein
MSRVNPGPRTYKIFVSHRFGDDDIYGQLRRLLNQARNFSWKNLSIPIDNRLIIGTDRGLKISITRKIKRADVLLVFAHSAGRWIEHELDAAQAYGIPVISVLDPARADGPKRRVVKFRRITDAAQAEVSLNDPALVVEAIRKYARPQAAERASGDLLFSGGAPFKPAGPQAEPATPEDIAKRMRARSPKLGLIGRLGVILFGHHGSASRRERSR